MFLFDLIADYQIDAHYIGVWRGGHDNVGRYQ